MSNRKTRLYKWLIPWIILAQITSTLGIATLAAIQPTPQMVQMAALQLSLSQWTTTVLDGLAQIIQPLNGSPQVAQAAGSPALSISTATINVMNDSTILVPITFSDTDPGSISALNFSLVFDGSCLTFDNLTDATPADGIPDAITGLPSDYVGSVLYSATTTGGQIDFSMHDPDTTQAALDGSPAVTLMTLHFGIQSSCRTLDSTPANGNTAAVLFDFSGATFGNTVGAAVAGTATDGTKTLRFDAVPTALALNTHTVNENVTLGTTVGTFSTTDADTSSPGDSYTYSLVNGTGDTGNGFFTIVGSALKTNTALNYELKNSYSILVRTTDSYGGLFEQQFTISVNDVNEAPTSLSISASFFDEDATSGTTVGTFSALDPDASSTLSYAFVNGKTGSTDNGSFAIVSGVLETNASFNYEVKNAYTIRVGVTDNGGLTFENIFTIRVKDVNDAPIAVDDTIDPANQVISDTYDIFVLANDTDQDVPHTLTVVPASLHLDSGDGTVATSNSNKSVRYTPSATRFNGPVSFSYQANDGTVDSNLANVTFQVVAQDQRGDCNGDGAINAGDFPAFVLEIADTTLTNGNTLHWYDAYKGTFVGSPLGCDANASLTRVTIADLTCAVLISFGNTACTAVPAQAATDAPAATLAVGSDLVGVVNGMVTVPVLLTTNGQAVAAASFAMNFALDQLSFDPADADHNGLPDAVTFHTPPGMVTVANYNAAASRLEITVYSVALPMPTLSDGSLVDVTFQVNAQTTATEAPVTLLHSSLGNDQGQAVPLEVQNSAVHIAQTYPFFLPLLMR